MRVLGSSRDIVLRAGRKGGICSLESLEGGVEVGLQRVRQMLEDGRQGGTLRC